MSRFRYGGYVGLGELSRAFGIPASTIAYRVKVQKLSVEQAISAKKNQIVVKPPKRPKRGSYKPREEKLIYIGIKYPDLLSPLWKLALGISKDLGVKQCQ